MPINFFEMVKTRMSLFELLNEYNGVAQYIAVIGNPNHSQNCIILQTDRIFQRSSSKLLMNYIQTYGNPCPEITD